MTRRYSGFGARALRIGVAGAGRALLGGVLGLTLPAFAADQAVDICYNYGCSRSEQVAFTDADFEMVQTWLGAPASAAEERLLIGRAIAIMYVAAARTTPIWRDRGGNFPHDPEDHIGVMDCIDHSANVTRFLEVLAARSLLRFHRAGPRVKRMRFLQDHWAGQVVERATAESYAVDAWYFDHGVPALVLPMAQWRVLPDPWDL